MARASNLNCGDETAPSVSLDPYSFGDRPNQSVLNYLDKALPQVFRNYTPGATDTFQYRLLHEFKTHYRFSSLLFWSSVYSNGKPIYAVACQLILIVSFLFFLLALCFELQGGDKTSTSFAFLASFIVSLGAAFVTVLSDRIVELSLFPALLSIGTSADRASVISSRKISPVPSSESSINSTGFGSCSRVSGTASNSGRVSPSPSKVAGSNSTILGSSREGSPPLSAIVPGRLSLAASGPLPLPLSLGRRPHVEDNHDHNHDGESDDSDPESIESHLPAFIQDARTQAIMLQSTPTIDEIVEYYNSWRQKGMIGYYQSDDYLQQKEHCSSFAVSTRTTGADKIKTSSRSTKKGTKEKTTKRSLGSAEIAKKFKNLSRDILAQRGVLNWNDMRVFDTQWSIVPDELNNIDCYDVAWLESDEPYLPNGVEKTLCREISACEVAAEGHIARLHGQGEHIQGLTILHMLIADVLGGDSPAAKIFLAKTEEDFPMRYGNVRSVMLKVCLLITIVGVVIVCCYFGASFMAGWNGAAQNTFIITLMVLLLLEFCVFEALECLITSVLIPNLVSEVVCREFLLLKKKLGSIITMDIAGHVCDIGGNRLSRFGILDVSQYLFVSTQIAQEFPLLLESQLVSVYHSHLPNLLAKKWHVFNKLKHSTFYKELFPNRVKKSMSKSVLSKIRAWGHNTLVYIGIMVGCRSMEQQKLIIRVLQPLLLYAIVSLCVLISSDLVASIVVLSLLFVLTVCLIYDEYVIHGRKWAHTPAGTPGATTPRIVGGAFFPDEMPTNDDMFIDLEVGSTATHSNSRSTSQVHANAKSTISASCPLTESDAPESQSRVLSQHDAPLATAHDADKESAQKDRTKRGRGSGAHSSHSSRSRGSRGSSSSRHHGRKKQINDDNADTESQRSYHSHRSHKSHHTQKHKHKHRHTDGEIGSGGGNSGDDEQKYSDYDVDTSFIAIGDANQAVGSVPTDILTPVPKSRKQIASTSDVHALGTACVSIAESERERVMSGDSLPEAPTVELAMPWAGRDPELEPTADDYVISSDDDEEENASNTESDEE